MTPLEPQFATAWPPGRRAIPHLLFLLLSALLIYQPWSRVPFPMVDYSEFLRPFQQGSSSFSGLANVIDYYQSHGRSSYLAYLQLGLNWHLFREYPAGWNIAVFLYMALAVVAVWLLLVRLGNAPMAATAAAMLCLVSTPAVDVWLRPTGEPLVLWFTSIALITALSYQRAERWRLRAVTLFVLFLGIGLAKDLLTPLLLVPFAVALCWNDGIRMPRWTARNVTLLVGTVLVTATLALSIWYALSQRQAEAYTKAYSRANISPLHIIGNFWTALLPYTRDLTNTPVSAAQIIANVLFIALLIVGWTIVMRGERRARARAELNCWLALLLLGSLLYLPLGWFSPFYALPFALASIALFARAFSAIESSASKLRPLARVVVAFILLVGAASAWNTARRETASRRIHGQLAHTVARAQGIDSMVVTWPAVNKWQWAQHAVVIRHYAITVGALTDTAPPAGDALCGTVGPGVLTKRVLLINYPEKCGDLPFAASELSEAYLAFNPFPEQRTLRLQLVIVAPDSTVARRSR